MTLSYPNPGFKVAGYSQVGGTKRVFNCTKHSCRSLGALPKTCKKQGVIVENYAQEGLKFFSLRTIGCYTASAELLIRSSDSPEGTSEERRASVIMNDIMHVF